MLSDPRSRRVGALAVTTMTAAVAALAVGASTELQPVALPVVFGVALATAIDPRLWLVHLGGVTVGLLCGELLPVLQAGPHHTVGVDTRLLLSSLVPAFIGGAMVRLACRSAL